MTKAYLTIDDSPSKTTKPFVDALGERGIQAIFFCRGDRIEGHLYDLVYAIKKGHVIGNHSYAHKRSSTMSLEEWAADLQQTEKLIEEVYFHAVVKRPAKYYRFPYLDRGDGLALERIWPEIITRVAAGESYALAENEAVRARQNYLKEQGFAQPFSGLRHPLYKNVPAIAGAVDVLLTETTQDWRMLARHLAKESITLEDLKVQMLADPFIAQGVFEHIPLIHDDPEIYENALAMLDFMREELGFTFQPLDL